MDRKKTVKYFYEVVVTNHLIMEGTHKGEWLGMKPTNKKLIFNGVDVDKVTDGKIVEREQQARHSDLQIDFKRVWHP